MTLSPRPWIAEQSENGTWRVICRSAVPRGAPVIICSFMDEADARAIAKAHEMRGLLVEAYDALVGQAALPEATFVASRIMTVLLSTSK